MENNGGGRILEYKGDYLISTGFFAQNKNSGIYKYPQDINSSFGKIIRIYKNDKEFSSEIYSYGHRNPQGLIFSKKNNKIISLRSMDLKEEMRLILLIKTEIMAGRVRLGEQDTIMILKLILRFWPKNLEDYGCKNNSKFIEPLFSCEPICSNIARYRIYWRRIASRFNNNILFGSLKAASIFRLYIIK